MDFILGCIYILVTGAVVISMVTLFLLGVRDKANNRYLLCQAMVSVWCASRVISLHADNTWQLAIGNAIGNFGICFVGTFWLYFAITYTATKLPKCIVCLPMVWSVFCYGAVLTSPWHNLYYKKFTFEDIVHGPLFFCNVGLTYTWVICGVVVLYRGMDRHADSKKKNNIQVGRAMIVIAACIPVLFNALYLCGVVHSEFDITPLGFAFSVILVMLGTIKYQFIDSRKELAIAQEKLLLAQERNRIAQQVHDTAGHTLTMIQSYMKLAEVSLKKEQIAEAETYVADARSLTSKGIRELREAINQLRAEESYELVTQGVMQLANQIKELSVEVTVQGEDDEKYSYLSKIVYATVRETITNTLKYADANKIEIILRFQENGLELIIGDDGKGCSHIVDNNGLRGIRERIEAVNGTVRFLSSEGEGFLTRVKVPL